MSREKMQVLIGKQQTLLDIARQAGRALEETELLEMERLQEQIDALRGAEEKAEQGEQSAITAERQRMSEIYELCRDFEMDAGEFIRSGTSVDAVRSAVLQKLKENGAPVRGSASVKPTGEENLRRDMADGLMLRSGMRVEKETAEARGFRHASMRDMAILCLGREGENTDALLRMDSNQLYERMARQFYNPTAAFPAILDTAIQKSIVQVYQDVPTTFQEWAGEGTLKDFKSTDDHSYMIGGAGDLLLVPENGELKADLPRTEKLPSRRLDTYGRQFSMSRQAFINDDIGFLTEVPALYAARAKRQINRQCYRVLYENKQIFDGKTLFHADHHNLMATGTAPSVESVKEMLILMMTQKDPFGESINVAPDKVIVPVGYDFLLDVILNSEHMPGSANNDVNPLRNKRLKVIADGELNALAGENPCPWFLAANWATARGIQVDYLNGQKQPTVRRGEKPGMLGFVWDIYLDWGICVRDFRGIAKNPGAVL